MQNNKIGYDFKTSSFCGECSCGCVEIKQNEDRVFVRSTFKKDTVAEFTFDEWEVFLQGAKNGDFDIVK